MPSTLLLGPIATMADYEPLEHPKIADLRRRAQVAMKTLRRVTEYREELGEWKRMRDSDAPGMEAWRISLRHMRELHAELESGLATHRFSRELRKHAPDLVGPFEIARAAAIDALRERRAFAAVITGESDDRDLGIQVLPAAPDAETYVPVGGKSVDFEW